MRHAFILYAIARLLQKGIYSLVVYTSSKTIEFMPEVDLTAVFKKKKPLFFRPGCRNPLKS